MKHNEQNNHRNLRNKTLVGAIAGALALGFAGAAVAAPDPTPSPMVYTLLPGIWTQDLASMNFLHTVENQQGLAGPVTASLTGNSVVVEGFLSGTPITNSNNTLQALAQDATTGLPGANGADNAADLSLLGKDEVNEGLGILSGQVAANAQVQTSVDSGSIATVAENFTSGTIAHSSNTIQASSAINSASNQVSGVSKGDVAGTTSGAVSIGFSASDLATDTLSSSGTVAIGNVQTAANSNAGFDEDEAQSFARVSDSNISVTDYALDAPITVGVTANSNTIAADYSSNQADNGFQATSGPMFTGSVSVANVQTNTDSSVAPPPPPPGPILLDGIAQTSSQVLDSTIGLDLEGSLAGTATLSDNTVRSSAQGNNASNQLSFAAGVDVKGNLANGTLGTNTSAGDTDTVAATGDLVVANSQANVNTGFSSYVEDANVSATVGNLEAGSALTLDGNNVLGTSSGNIATNAVSADDTNFSANTIVANQQVNEDTAIASRVEDSGISALVFSDEDEAAQGSIALSNSSVGSSAIGNQAQTSIDLNATNFATYNNVDQVYAQTGRAWTDKAGVGASNLQNNATSDVLADTEDSGIESEIEGNITGGSITLQNNALSSSATGNRASTSIALSGTDGVAGGQLTNSQSNTGSTTANVGDNGIAAFVDGDASGTALAVGGNSISATATGNRASNSVSADFANLSVGHFVDTWVTPSSAITVGNEHNTSEAPFGIASNQFNDSVAIATMSDDTLGVHLDDVTGGSLTLSDNNMTASAISNNVGNSMDIGGGNLSTDHGSDEQVASLGNLQVTAPGSSSIATVSVEGDDARKVGQIGAFIDGNANGLAASVSGNAVQALAYGNAAANMMTASGDNYTPTAPAMDLQSGNVGYSEVGTAGGADSVMASFALQNVQANQESLHTATVANGNVGINLTQGSSDDRHAVTDSTLAIADNSVIAEARDNYASNTLGLGVSYAADGTATANPFTALTTTAALQNVQSSDEGSVASASSGLLGVIAGHYDFTGSTLTLTGNSIASTAVSNTGINELDVAAGELTGDGYHGGVVPSVGINNYSWLDDGYSTAVAADYGLSNAQETTDESVMANVSGSGIGVGIGEGSLNGGSVAITSNALTALAQQNSASNVVNLLGTDVNAIAAVSNVQTVDGGNTSAITDTDAATGLGFALQVNGAVGSSDTLPVTVSDNKMTAQAGANDATNALNVSADSSLGGSMFAVVSSANEAGVASGVSANYSLENAQTSTGTVLASMVPGLTGIEVVGMDANGVPSTIGNAEQGSSLTVTGNQFTSQASANTADNSINMAAATTNSASAGLYNTQTAAEGAVISTVSNASVGIYNRNAGQDQGGAITNAAMNVTGNGLTAAASGNSASNAVVIQPAALNAATVINTQSIIEGSTVTMADYAVLNAQNNSAGVSAAVSNSTIGVNPDAGVIGARGSASQIVGGNVTVTGNNVVASAMGNSASNSITLASASGTMPSSSLVSNQINTASVNASVNNVTIGMSAGGILGMSNSPITVTGNTITASAVGNTAVNHIGITK